MTTTPEHLIHTDGGSRGNPGPAAYAYIIESPGQPAIEEKGFLGESTNNIAEYTGLIRALEHAKTLSRAQKASARARRGKPLGPRQKAASAA